MFIIFFLTGAFYNSADPWTCAERLWCNGLELPAARYKLLVMMSRLYFFYLWGTGTSQSKYTRNKRTTSEQCTYDVTLKRYHVTIVAEEKQ